MPASPAPLTASIARGTTDVPLIEQTIGALFDAVTARQPDHEALASVHQRRRYTYRELQTEARCLASALLGLGLQPGDRVGIWSHNNVERVVRDMPMEQLTIAYGMTETSPVSCQSSVDTPLEKRVSTVGQVQPHLEVKIIDRDTGAIVPPGQTLSEDEVRAFCKGQIAHYKVPRYIRFVPEFPMTVTGKI